MNTTQRLKPLVLAVIGVTLAFGTTRASLLAYFPFDGDFMDASGNNNHLSVALGSPTITTTEGEFVFGGGALDVDSTISDAEYLDLTTPISFGAGDAWSVVFWARHRPGNDGRVGMIVGDLTSTDFIWIPRDGAVDGIRFRNSSNQNADYTTPPAGVEPAGEYHHFAVVADGAGNIEVFYDAASLGAMAIDTAFTITSVAQAFNQTTQSMSGQIDELYIYDEAISEGNINELYTGITDMTPPAISAGDIVDDQGGGPVSVNALVTYTLTFSEDMDAASVDASDFGNAGTAPVDIGEIIETSPGVFSVLVIPSGPGSLQLEIAAGAVLSDFWGNALDTATAIADDTTIAVEPDTEPPMASGLGPMAGGTGVPPDSDLTLTFDELVQAGSGNITIHRANGTVVETIDVGSASVAIDGVEVIINPVAALTPLTTYYVTIDDGAFTDLSGNAYPGIDDSATWSFTTADTLLAYYPFDTDFSDASANANDLSAATGTPAITTTAGEFVYGGGALDVDSTPGDQEYLELANPITFEAGDAWSIAFWARRRPGADFRQGMVIGDPGNATDFIWVPDNPTQVQGLRFRSSSNENANYGVFPDDGEWHHWVVVADGSGSVLAYRDNMPLQEIAMASAFSITSVAHAYNQTTQSMNGQIDELYIFSEAITAEKVDALFNGAAQGEARLPLRISGNGANLEFEWESKAGMYYLLWTSLDLAAEFSTWSSVNVPGSTEVDGVFQIAATPPVNSLTLPRPADPTRFYRVEEFTLPPVAIFEESFDLTGAGQLPAGWTAGFDPSDSVMNTSWELGDPSGGPDTGPDSAFSGSHCVGTNLVAVYGTESNVWLRSPSIDLSSATAATLTFQHWVDIDPFFDQDHGVVRVLDAGTLTELGVVEPAINGLDPSDWTEFSQPLPEAAHGQPVIIEFRFVSDDEAFFDQSGWYIDDVLVTVPAP